MLWQTLASLRDVGRLYEIASVLIRYGFGDLVRRVGLADMLERAGRALSGTTPTTTRTCRRRRACAARWRHSAPPS